jgi:bisphosphoglycerate-independent phosphoglycerate mutase (AlkP superfamily)
MLQLESMRVVNATLVRIKEEIEQGTVEDAEELSKLAKEASLAVLDIQIKLDLKN